AQQAHGSAEVGRVVAADHALGAVHHADAQHHAAADVVTGLVAGQRADLQERAVRVEEERDALPDEQLAAAPVALDRPLPAAERRLLEQAADLAEQAEHALAVRLERLAGRVDAGGQDWCGHPGQPVWPSRRARIWSIPSSAPPPMDSRRLSRK